MSIVLPIPGELAEKVNGLVNETVPLEQLYQDFCASNRGLTSSLQSKPVLKFNLATLYYLIVRERRGDPRVCALCEFFLYRTFVTREEESQQCLEAYPFLYHALGQYNHPRAYRLVKLVLLYILEGRGREVGGQSLATLEAEASLPGADIKGLSDNTLSGLLQALHKHGIDEVEAELLVNGQRVQEENSDSSCRRELAEMYQKAVEGTQDDENSTGTKRILQIIDGMETIDDQLVTSVNIEGINWVTKAAYEAILRERPEAWPILSERGLASIPATNEGTDYVHRMIAGGDLDKDQVRELVYAFCTHHLVQGEHKVTDQQVRLLAIFVLSLHDRGLLKPESEFRYLYSLFMTWMHLPEAKRAYLTC
uniref:ARAD1B03872p n=1 Tax=Blastobotrys adeninivorans TaxID=409370 RepID=A0A060TAW3_BLAAD